MAHRVGLIIGSLRAASFSRRVANALPALAPASLAFEEIPIRDLPLYNADLEADLPGAWWTFRSAVLASDALLFVTPEYNRSMPGCLKNAIDVASKPNGKNCWNGKSAGVMGLSSGPLGGLAVAYSLRQALVAVNVATLAHPEVYLSNAAKLFDDEGQLVPSTRDFLKGYLEKFADWVGRMTGPLPVIPDSIRDPWIAGHARNDSRGQA